MDKLHRFTFVEPSAYLSESSSSNCIDLTSFNGTSGKLVTVNVTQAINATVIIAKTVRTCALNELLESDELQSMAPIAYPKLPPNPAIMVNVERPLA